jgi:hypothetical protein
MDRTAGLVHIEQSGGCSSPKSAPSLEKRPLRVMVMVVVVMVVTGSKSRGAGEDCEKQNDRENLFHGPHPSRIDLVMEASCDASNQERNEAGADVGSPRIPLSTCHLSLLGNWTPEA